MQGVKNFFGLGKDQSFEGLKEILLGWSLRDWNLLNEIESILKILAILHSLKTSLPNLLYALLQQFPLSSLPKSQFPFGFSSDFSSQIDTLL